MADLTQEAWKEGLANDPEAIVLDVRTPEEYEEGHIEGALHIDIYLGQGFLDAIGELDATKAHYVYCRSGSRSAQACAVMAGNGFAQVHNLMGGMMEYDGPLVEGPPPSRR